MGGSVPLGVRVAVLLEGPSDVAAVRAVAAAHGLGEREHGFRLVDMGGATNIRRHLQRLRSERPGVRVLGMCDAGEAPFFARALDPDGGPDAVGTLGEHGFQVCVADLEDELIRALGTDRVMGVLERLGLAHRLAAFRQQVLWRDRPLHECLHRFAGIASGRKILLAGELAAALEPEEAPPPLRRLVADLVAVSA
jgi:hypothetical protein